MSSFQRLAGPIRPAVAALSCMPCLTRPSLHRSGGKKLHGLPHHCWRRISGADRAERRPLAVGRLRSRAAEIPRRRPPSRPVLSDRAGQPGAAAAAAAERLPSRPSRERGGRSIDPGGAWRFRARLAIFRTAFMTVVSDAQSQTRASLSHAPVRMRRPSALQPTPQMCFAWPASSRRQRPVSRSLSRGTLPTTL